MPLNTHRRLEESPEPHIDLASFDALQDHRGRAELLHLVGDEEVGREPGQRHRAEGAVAAEDLEERLGKGFRGPPRDAWLSSMAPEGSRGYAFGVNKALDKSGAVVGPLIADISHWFARRRGLARQYGGASCQQRQNGIAGFF